MRKPLHQPLIAMLTFCWGGVLFLASCQSPQANQDAEWAYFGDSITVDGAVDVSELPERMKGLSMTELKLSG
ncbi:MAG: hypothetical protein ACO3CL_01285, partial [Bacteroidia bacterium]